MSLTVGDMVPYFELKDQKGELFKSDSVIGKKPVVVYFTPKMKPLVAQPRPVLSATIMRILKT